MEQLNGYELQALLKFWINGYPPHALMANRILELAQALKVRVTAKDAAEGTL